MGEWVGREGGMMVEGVCGLEGRREMEAEVAETSRADRG